MNVEELSKFCDAALEKVQKEVKMKIFKTGFMKNTPLLESLDLKIMKAYEREITQHLSHREQMRRTESRLRLYHFNYPERSLRIEEMLNKIIDEGKQEHEDMRAFIMTSKPPTSSYCDVNGVTTRGRKTTTQDAHDNDTNLLPKEPVVVKPKKLVGSNEVLTNDQPQTTSEPVIQPSNETQTPQVPFPRRLRKEKEEAQ
ncbi:hypothetical protein Tco_0252660 [Tanacetum coccineum]